MELKELILSTLEELDQKVKEEAVVAHEKELEQEQLHRAQNKSEERQFLEHTKERLLVLFEGLQDPSLKDKQDKLNMTLEYLEYLLGAIEDRIAKSE